MTRTRYDGAIGMAKFSVALWNVVAPNDSRKAVAEAQLRHFERKRAALLASDDPHGTQDEGQR